MRLLKKSKSPEILRNISGTASRFKYLSVFMLLSCLLIDPMLGTFTWLHYKKAAVQKEVKRKINEGMDRDKLVLLQFSKEETETELLWSHPREFEYNNKMYDIVETKTEGDTVYYWCWYDHEETLLKREMEKAADQALGKDHSVGNETAILMSLSKTLYFPFLWNGNVSVPDFLCNQGIIFYHLYSQVIFQPPTPPPQFSRSIQTF